MLTQYTKSIKNGFLKLNTPTHLINDWWAILQFSDDRGYGQPTEQYAMNVTIEWAKQLEYV